MKKAELKEFLNKAAIIVTIIDICIYVSAAAKWILAPNQPRSFYVFLLCISVVQSVFTITLWICYRKNQYMLSLLESLGNERASLFTAIKMVLNKSSHSNNTRITQAILMAEVVNPLKQSDKYSTNYDMKFTWKLMGENTTGKKLDKLYFRLAGDSTVAIDKIDFQAIQIIGSECHEMSYKRISNETESNFFIYELGFKEALEEKSFFKLEVSYIWPKCYNALVDYLIIAPFNFSNTALDEFEINIIEDGRIITPNSHARLFRMIAHSTKRRSFEGIGDLNHQQDNGTCIMKKSMIKCEKHYLYFVEIEARQ